MRTFKMQKPLPVLPLVPVLAHGRQDKGIGDSVFPFMASARLQPYCNLKRKKAFDWTLFLPISLMQAGH